jgi:hypothetical protein
MAKFTNFFKIASQNTATTTMVDNQFVNGVTTGSTSWYYTIIQGTGSRLSRYNEYNIMDNDVEVHRALNIIAENMCSMNITTNMPLNIEIIKEDGQEVDDTLILTLNAALRRWCEIHKFNHNRLFKIARNMVKYGDVFFRKKDDFKSWEYIAPQNVLGAVVNINDVSEIVGYQVKPNIKHANNSTQFSNIKNNESEFVQASDMIRFTLSDDMDDEFPFGLSILKTSYKVHKQITLLEDSMVIYKICRSTSRRIFKVPIKNMNPARAKQYLETIKREITQKHVPSKDGNGDNSIDSQYSPAGVLSDIFLSVACLSLDTHINIVGIGPITLFEIIHRFKRGQKLQAYTINQDTGNFKIDNISWAGITKHDAKIIKLYFSNGTYLECTPDHKMIKYNLGECFAENLQIGERLASHDYDEIFLEKMEIIEDSVSVGCITIDTIDNNHNFQLESGIFVRNSDGTGISVEKLDGDNSIGELFDLKWLFRKFVRSINVPLSYMLDDESKSIFNDGKVGQSFIEEQIFYNFIGRLQIPLEVSLTDEFKKFLFSCNINIDPSLYKLKLPETANYKKYQQSDADNAFLSTTSQADSIPYLSKRMILKRYLQLSEAEILENEQLLKEERSLALNVDKTLASLYGAPAESMGGGMGGGFGGDMGMGGEPIGSPMEGGMEGSAGAMPPSPEPQAAPPM